MAARKNAQSAAQSALIASLMADSKPVREKKSDRKVLAAVRVNDDMAKADRDRLLGSVEVVKLALGEYLTGAREGLAAATIDPATITLTKKPNGEVSANLPIPFATPDGTRYVNLTVSLGGVVGDLLRPFSGEKKPEEETAPAPKPRGGRSLKTSAGGTGGRGQ